jgi:hypothetical protein
MRFLATITDTDLARAASSEYEPVVAYVYAANMEDAQTFMQNWMNGWAWSGAPMKLQIEEAPDGNLEVDVMYTPSFEDAQWEAAIEDWNTAYDKAEAEQQKAKEELLMLIVSNANILTVQKAMDKWRLAIEERALALRR